MLAVDNINSVACVADRVACVGDPMRDVDNRVKAVDDRITTVNDGDIFYPSSWSCRTALIHNVPIGKNGHGSYAESSR
jgi:hypothetical protein